jgi:hypothetical protein
VTDSVDVRQQILFHKFVQTIIRSNIERVKFTEKRALTHIAPVGNTICSHPKRNFVIFVYDGLVLSAAVKNSCFNPW